MMRLYYVRASRRKRRYSMAIFFLKTIKNIILFAKPKRKRTSVQYWSKHLWSYKKYSLDKWKHEGMYVYQFSLFV